MPMHPADLYLKLTVAHAGEVLLNLAPFALLTEDPGGGTALYPVSLDERHDGVATRVLDGIDEFHGLPGFVPVMLVLPEGRGLVKGFVNMAKSTGAFDAGDHRVIRLSGTTKAIRTNLTLDAIMGHMTMSIPSAFPD